MGGNAFKDINRLTRPQFDDLTIHVTQLLTAAGYNVTCPKIQTDKSSFGDIDLYISASKPELSELVGVLGAIEPPVVFGNNFHFLLPGRFQVDLTICQNKENCVFHAAICSNGDLVMILNRSLRLHKLLLNEHGQYSIAGKSRVLVSRDLAHINVLLECEIGARGMTQVEIFEAIYNSRFFDSSVYTITDHKRTMVNEFTDWVAGKEAKSPGRMYTDPGYHGKLLDTVFSGNVYNKMMFNQVITELKTRELVWKKKCKMFVDGNLVKQLVPGIHGPVISRVLETLKHGLGYQGYHSYLESTPTETLHSKILEIYNSRE